MFRLVAISLAILTLLQSISLGIKDIIQLDELIEHASYHKEQYGDSLLTFLSKHYGELKSEHDQKHQQEPDEHRELPFQNTAQFFVSTTPTLVPAVLILQESVETNPLKNNNFFYLPPTSSLFRSGIFQPPRSTSRLV